MPILTCSQCDAKNRVDERARTQRPVCGRCHAPLSGASGSQEEVIGATDAVFDQLIASPIPILIDCWAPWCGPCRMIAPTIEQLAQESNGHYRVAKLNVDENPRTASRFGVSSIPTLLIFKNGRLVDRIVGLQPKEALARRLQMVAA